ncbi:MAG: hypothetical protein M3R17_00595 [Bacteroidota bacterium]|nr:hypothetical protein [Bacteroidota bacterium]
MKHLFLIFILPLLLFTSFRISTTDFDAQLNEVVADFKQNIFDQQKCESASKKAGDISDAIEEALNEDGLDKSERKKLEGLKKEAEALEDYILAIGDITGGFETVEKMNLANSRVKGEITSVQKGDFCVDIISVSIGDFICYLAENNSSKIISVNYKWKGPDGTKSGSGTIKVFAASVYAMYSNRKDKEVKKVTFMGLTCK